MELKTKKSSRNAASARVASQPAERPNARLASWWRMGCCIANVLRRWRFLPKRQSRDERGEVPQLLNLCCFRGARSCAYGIVDRMLERDYRCVEATFGIQPRSPGLIWCVCWVKCRQKAWHVPLCDSATFGPLQTGDSSVFTIVCEMVRSSITIISPKDRTNL